MADRELAPETLLDLLKERALVRLGPRRIEEALLQRWTKAGPTELVGEASNELARWVERPLAAPIAAAATAVALGPAVLIHDAQKATFSIGNVPQWVIDTAFFGATAALTVSVANGVTHITLAGAFYPGTTLPADFKAQIREENGVWMLRLRLAIGGFDATLPLEAFLNRSQPALSIVVPDLQACPLGPATALGLRGAGGALFTPDWLLVIAGPGIWPLQGLGDSADLAFVVPLLAGAPQVFLDPSLRRTWIHLRGADELAIEPTVGVPAPRPHRGTATFDSVTIEAGLDASEVAQRFLLADAVSFPAGAPRFGFEPGGDLVGSDGQPWRAVLKNARYAVLYGDDRTELARAFLGELEEVLGWLHAPGASLWVTRAAHLPFASVLDRPAQAPLALLLLERQRVALRIPDLLVKPDVSRGVVVFSWGDPPQTLPPQAALLSIDGAQHTSTLQLPPPLQSHVVRRDDFFVATFGYHHMRFEASGDDARLLPAASDPALRVTLPPQNIGEQAFFKTDAEFPRNDTNEPSSRPAPPATPNVPAPPVKALLAEPSRLVFSVPATIAALQLSASRLLAWQDLDPALAPTALPGSVALQLPQGSVLKLPGPGDIELEVSSRLLRRRRRIRRPIGNVRRLPALFIDPRRFFPSEPGPLETAIEAPFRLIISPSSDGGWKHAMTPVTQGAGRNELWHTRLGIRGAGTISEEPDPRRIIRAIWARDYREDPNAQLPFDSPFLMSLFPSDRSELVKLTAHYALADQIPVPVAVRRLMLSSLGAWLDVHGRFEPKNQTLSIEEWRHQATLGRDHYVRVVYAGFLYPFGHRASLVKITEREIERTPDRDLAAYLRQRIYIVVREPERRYDKLDEQGRGMPLKRVRITTAVTPNLDQPYSHPNGDFLASAPNPPLAAFWPRVGKQLFRFHVKTEDWEGREADFAIPMAFVRRDVVATSLGTTITRYNAAADEFRSAGTGGQLVAFAPTSSETQGKTSFETLAVRFAVDEMKPAPAAGTTPVHPRLDRAKVDLAPLRQMAKGESAADIDLEPYIDKDFGAANQAQLFAKVTSSPSLDYSGGGGTADKSGGVATPGMLVRGLSRNLGVVGDSSDSFIGGQFDPLQFFSGALNANLLGGITLAQILDTVTGAEFAGKVPQLVTENLPEFVRTELKWSTNRFKTNALPFVSTGATQLTLNSVLMVNRKTAATQATLSGVVTSFGIELAKVVRVDFKQFSFESVNGKKPDVHIVVSGLKFLAPLEFVNNIADALQLNNFSDPPFLDIGPQGVTVGYGLTLPSIPVGAIALINLALGARLNLPFTGDPMRLRFNLSEREKPFTVSVAPFGGGGFFALAVGMDGVEVIEASIEFGGAVAINLGVASGGVFIMAGIYFRLVLKGEGQSELTGYVRAGGSLMVLGIITISMEFYLGLSYSDGKAWGQVTVTVKVEVVCFSSSVSISMRKTFAGSSGDPPLRTLMPQPRWAAYCAKFATEAA